MRIQITQDIVLTYTQPARQLLLAMRLMPRDHDSQIVSNWRIEPSLDGRMRAHDDAMGNLVHDFATEGAVDHLQISVRGTVETFDTAGIVRGLVERLPLAVWLRMTPQTTPDAPLRQLADDLAKPDRLGTLHGLMAAIAAENASPAATAKDRDIQPRSIARGADRQAGSPEDIADADALHEGWPQAPRSVVAKARRFVAAARHVGQPARIVKGFVAAGAAAEAEHGRLHVWAEAHVEGFGWIAFDPHLDVCPTSRHVRVAAGLDADDAAPLRVAGIGRIGETIGTRVAVHGAGQ